MGASFFGLTQRVNNGAAFESSNLMRQFSDGVTAENGRRGDDRYEADLLGYGEPISTPQVLTVWFRPITRARGQPHSAEARWRTPFTNSFIPKYAEWTQLLVYCQSNPLRKFAFNVLLRLSQSEILRQFYTPCIATTGTFSLGCPPPYRP